MKKSILTLALALLCTTIWAAIEINGIYYSLSSNGTATVTSNSNKYSGSVTIPATVIDPNNGKTYSVTSIGYKAFYGCTGLTSVTIGNSVTSIGDYAFYGCTGLQSVTIGNSVTSIGEYAFQGCTGLMSIKVEAGNTKYDSRNNCNALIETATNTLIKGCQNTVIPNSVTSIGGGAFTGCTGLTSVTIPENVTNIGEAAFGNCTGLTSVIWNAKNCSGVQYIEDAPFRGCENITSFVFGNEVESIPSLLFYGMINLKSITIPNSVTSIGEGAFDCCRGLTNVTIGNGVTSIGDWAFAYCSGLTSIEIPNSVTSIGSDAFGDCTGLTSVTIPNSVTSIGSGAFDRCNGLQYIIYAGSATGSPWGAPCDVYAAKDGYFLFEDAAKTILGYCLPEAKGPITIPNSVTSIWYYAFDDCYDLDYILYAGSYQGDWIHHCGVYAVKDGYFLFADVAKKILGRCLPEATGSITIPNSVTSIGGGAFYGCSGLTSIEIPNSVTSIGEEAFYGCTGLTSITIPESVTNVGDLKNEGVFSGCTSLTSVVWNAKNCVEANFRGIRENITSFVFGDEVVSIPAYLCSGMTKLTSISFPESVKTIGDQAFEGCTGLENIYCYRSMPPNAYSTAFDGVDKFSCVLHVPSASIDFYKNATAWRDFYYTTILGAETATTAVTSLEIIPHEDNADIMWPVVADAMTYEFTITHDGAVVCTLKFNSEGQLMGIILYSVRAPAQNSNYAPSNGFWFNVTGLENGSEYTLTIVAKNSAGNVVRTFTQNFTTGATAIEEINADGVALKPRKVLEEGRVIILLPDGRKFDANGRMLER